MFTNNPELKLIAESFRDWGRDCYCVPSKDNTCGKRFCCKLGNLPEGYDPKATRRLRSKYTYSHLGYNLKITDMQAACGLAQMDRVEGFVQARRDNFAYLHDKLQSCKEFLILCRTQRRIRIRCGLVSPITLKSEADFRRVDLLAYLDQIK